MPKPDEPTTNEPLPMPPDETGLASGIEDTKLPEAAGADAPSEGATAHEAFEKAKADTERRR